jgi:hypothetical protein
MKIRVQAAVVNESDPDINERDYERQAYFSVVEPQGMCMIKA